jgi:hypothetical protein
LHCGFGILERGPCTADVGDRVGIAAEVACTLAVAFRIYYVIAKARIVRDRERPHVGLAFIQGAALRALEPGYRRRDGVHAFVIGDRTFESEIVEVIPVTVHGRVNNHR